MFLKWLNKTTLFLINYIVFKKVREILFLLSDCVQKIKGEVALRKEIKLNAAYLDVLYLTTPKTVTQTVDILVTDFILFFRIPIKLFI